MNIKVLKFTKNDLQESINGLSQIKPILQSQVLDANTDIYQGRKDAKELGEHYDTAINAMMMILAMMEDGEFTL